MSTAFNTYISDRRNPFMYRLSTSLGIWNRTEKERTGLNCYCLELENIGSFPYNTSSMKSIGGSKRQPILNTVHEVM